MQRMDLAEIGFVKRYPRSPLAICMSSPMPEPVPARVSPRQASSGLPPPDDKQQNDPEGAD
jgi:hypothetical protein